MVQLDNHAAPDVPVNQPPIPITSPSPDALPNLHSSSAVPPKEDDTTPHNSLPAAFLWEEDSLLPTGFAADTVDHQRSIHGITNDALLLVRSFPCIHPKRLHVS